MRTRCTGCGRESNIMGEGNGCHADGCSGHHVRIDRKDDLQ